MAHEIGVEQAGANDDVRHPERERTIGAGVDRNPLVRFGTGDALAGINIDDLGTIRSALPTVGIAGDHSLRIAAGFEQVGTEGKDIAAVLQIVRRQIVNALRQPEGEPRRFDVERIVRDGVGRTDRRGEAFDQRTQLAARFAVEKRETFGMTFVAQRAQARGNHLERLVPGDRLPLPATAFADAPQWRLNAIWIVEELEGGLPFGAE